MDHEIGSLEVGKRADVTVLADSPFDVDPSSLRDIAVRATIVGGVVHEVPGAAA
jgi:hypothetical protein